MSGQERIAKAWRVRHQSWGDADIVYARTASKARYDLKCRLGDCYPDLRFQQILAHRAPDHDLRLPAPHRLVAELSDEDRHVILHAYGYQGRRPEKSGYRDHFCTAPEDTRMLRLAWELGLFRGPCGERAYGDSGNWAGVFYYLTDLGKQVARSMMPTYWGEEVR